ncbi:F0F1 ATP synthase subunit gamma [Acidothermaceae bacterium B102]|nr:F0F1 ATP synthase subunit gamma [Acidothermaceae bacterium B102]
MGAQQRVFRRRIKSVQSTKKITRAMELIAASRIVKAQQRVAASTPYAEALTAVVQAVASNATTEHLLTTAREHPTTAAVLVVTSDRGLAGGYSSNALKTAESLVARLKAEGKEARLYVIGRKGASYYRFRGREMAGQWSGFSEQPDYSHAKEAADTVIEAFRLGAEGGGVDELHVVYTEFQNAVTQVAKAVRLLPLVVTEVHEAPETPLPLYEFEPSAEAVLDALLPRYVESRVWNALLQSAASESAARRRAMKAATDNADELIKTYVRQANAARQAEITQEIMEIVGGAEALSTTGSD